MSEIIDEEYRVWAEEEIEEVKVVAKMLRHAGFKKVHIARLLDVSQSSLRNWIKKEESPPG